MNENRYTFRITKFGLQKVRYMIKSHCKAPRLKEISEIITSQTYRVSESWEVQFFQQFMTMTLADERKCGCIPWENQQIAKKKTVEISLQVSTKKNMKWEHYTYKEHEI